MHHIIEKQLRDFAGTQCILPRRARYYMTQFPKLINTSNQSIVAIYLWETSDNVNSPMLKLVRWYW